MCVGPWREVNFGWWSLLLSMLNTLGPELDTLLTGSQRSRIVLLLCVGKFMRETRKEMGEMRRAGRGLHSLTSELNLRTFGTHRSR
jgi:hypothetical protein